MAKQERRRVKRVEKKEVQRARLAKSNKQLRACGWQVHHHVWPQQVWNMYNGGGFAAVCGVGDGSHGVEHGISDLCQGQPPGPSSDGGAGEGSLPDKEAIWVKEGQHVV